LETFQSQRGHTGSADDPASEAQPHIYASQEGEEAGDDYLPDQGVEDGGEESVVEPEADEDDD
jgi:hypothetical protein